jgi:hypothetical protein
MLMMLLMLVSNYTASAQEKKNFEFRAAWVATVDNIDWPSKKGLPVIRRRQSLFVSLICIKQTV